MPRLVVNPDKPDAWEIQLRPGANRIGRGEANDFQIADPSVSGSHCQVVVKDNVVTIQDLASTNGTFINGERVSEMTLLNGQKIRLGSVDLVFHAPRPATAAPIVPPLPVPSSGPVAVPTTSRLRVSGAAVAETVPPPLPAGAPPIVSPVAPISMAVSQFCKFHPKAAAAWFCSKCNRSFCELCVTSRPAGGLMKKICRTCGVECSPVHATISKPVAAGFFSSLPGTAIYPFRGSGVLILIFSAVLFSVASNMAGLFSIIFKIGTIGYLFCFMQNIIHATANEESEMPELPGMDDIFGGFLRLAGCVVMSFGLVIALLIARISGVDIPVSAILICVALGCLYFPMAFLVVAIKDTVMACNPLVVVPSILKIPLHYLVTVIIFMSIFGVQQIGNMVSGGAKSLTFSTTSMSVLLVSIGIRMIWSLLSVYLLTVNTRILGLLYSTQKEKLGW
ncbi:MAG TPA: FHA domain-containing protein [Verrucomicrobiae bacterium]|nr:FHA domain-containing protein [Verrucomicrobiae bacterium]